MLGNKGTFMGQGWDRSQPYIKNAHIYNKKRERSDATALKSRDKIQ